MRVTELLVLKRKLDKRHTTGLTNFEHHLLHDALILAIGALKRRDEKKLKAGVILSLDWKSSVYGPDKS